ncbi:MAG: type II secretion system protein [Phycisphaerales bacterium]
MRALVWNVGSSSCRRTASAFTIVDVLVSMAVIGVLISIIAPSLDQANKTARQVACRSNVRQLGIGIAMYADEHGDRIPNSTNVGVAVGNTSDQPWKTMTLRVPGNPGQAGRWDGLGLLAEDYLTAPKLYYCPSHTGDFRFADVVSAWNSEAMEVVGNYQYRARGPMQAPTSASPVQLTRRLSLIAPGAALVADGMRTQADFNHKVGANVLRANLSVVWYSDRSGKLAAVIPTNETQATVVRIEQAWSNLDAPN